MKRIIVLLLLISQVASAQTDSISIDQLQVPSSPALNLLDISPNSIERPKNPTDFALALGNATSGFTTLPKNYAMEIAPFWLFGKQAATFESFKMNKPGTNILQTATFSLGTADARSIIDSSEFRKVAIALKFSIWRGNLGGEFKKWTDTVMHFLGRIAKISGEGLADTINRDPVRRRLNNALLQPNITSDQRQLLMDSLTNRTSFLQSLIERSLDSLDDYQNDVAFLKNVLSRTDFRRYGFKMDYAIGTVIDYPNISFQKSYVSKVSTWLTFGFEKEGGLNWLGVIRYNHNLNRFYRNEANSLVRDINVGELDYGIRLYSDVTSKFTLSFELLKRKRYFNERKLTENNVQHPESTNRYVFSANYKVGKNQNLSFTYGKNFDNTQISEGNLIAALNFLIGFGSTRPFPSRAN